MNNSDNPHCTETEYSCRYHYNIYKDNTQETACGVNDNPTRIQLRPKSSSWPTLDFEMPRQRHDLERVELLMRHAYDRGVRDNMERTRAMFKMIIGL